MTKKPLEDKYVIGYILVTTYHILKSIICIESSYCEL